MIRAISFVLILAIALQTAGCSTWGPLARVNEVAEENRQVLMRDIVARKLTEGMVVRIKIRECTRTPSKGQDIECVIDKIGPDSLTVTPFTFFAPGNVRRKLTFHYSNIASIEYRESARGSTVIVAGVAVGTIFSYWLLLIALSGME